MVRLDGVLDSWKTIRRDTAQAILDMPAGEFEFRPTPDLMPFRDLAVHILNASHAMKAMLLAGEDDFAAAGFRERMRQHFLAVAALEPAEMAARLESVLEDDAARVREERGVDAAFWAAEMTRFDGARVTRLEMLQYAKEHELTHRSQMFMYLRLKGIVPSTTRRRMAAMAAAQK